MNTVRCYVVVCGLALLTFVLAGCANTAVPSADREGVTGAPPATTATAPAADATPPPDAAPAGAIAPAASFAASALAQKQQIPVEQIAIVKVETAAWPDGCLGLGQTFEICIQRVIPGYRVTLTAAGKTYIARTDQGGEIIRLEETSARTTPTAQCNNRAVFVGDVTAPDNTKIAPGQTFTKIWRLRNEGSCTWTRDYAIVFDSGDHLSGPDLSPLPGEVLPKQTVDISLTLTAPNDKGAYQGFWKLRAPSGETFSVGRNPFWVKIVVLTSLVVTPTPVVGSNISGWAWHDLCSPGKEAESTPTPPSGCVAAPGGGYQANGVYDAGEPRIGGMEVQLGAGACPSDGLRTVLADAEGNFTFEGLEAGSYCVSIDPLSDYNLPIFIPGVWTYPPDGAGAQTVTVDGVSSVQDVNFGWDYQFAP